MPLVSITLENALRKFMDQSFPGFDKFPESSDNAIELIASAVDQYASLVSPPSTKASDAKTAMKSAMQGLGSDDKGQQKIQDGIKQYALILAAGMSPAFTGVAPSAPLDLSPVAQLGNNNGSSADCAKQFSTIIDAWFKTGTATTPNGVTSLWL